jgi:type IV pilus assembly protein PilX
MRIAFPLGSLISNRRNRLAYIDRASIRQQGVVLMIALIVLVVMTIAGIALVRSVDTGNLVAGNLAFKQGATLAADVGTESAIAWLNPLNGSGTLYQNDATKGYYATSLTELDPTNASGSSSLPAVDWDNTNCAGIPNNGQCLKPAPSTTIDNDNTVSYLITRLCQIVGDPNASGNTCVTYQASDSTSPKRGEIKYGDDKRFEPLPGPYYRIVSRIKGPRNTISFVETIVHF